MSHVETRSMTRSHLTATVDANGDDDISSAPASETVGTSHEEENESDARTQRKRRSSDSGMSRSHVRSHFVSEGPADTFFLAGERPRKHPKLDSSTACTPGAVVHDAEGTDESALETLKANLATMPCDIIFEVRSFITSLAHI